MKTIKSNETSYPIGSTVHIFEQAGLGKAPFTYIGYYVKSGSCDYCFTGIVNNFSLRSSDGKVFKVGCNCIEKSGDAGLKKVVCKIKSDIAKKKREEKKKRDKQNYIDLLDKHATLLNSIPHSHEYYANQGKTMLDRLKWFSHENGMVELLKILTKHGVTEL